ncbi:MAG TPA: selenide, water dikinase SelD, partial [Geminicoccaceae bacterium]|nr:selenide, water dikinase SelD [Geminicoccaceae bacterium]
IGGGHSHVAVLKRFGMRPLPGVRLTLVARDVHTPYSGMLPGFVAGHYGFDDVHIDLGPLARFAGARLFHAEAVGLDLAGRRVLCRDRPPVPYDVLSINVGATPGLADVPGAAGSVVPVKPIDGFVARWREVSARILVARGPVRIGVVGGGAGGVELLLCVRYRLARLLEERGRRADHLAFHLLTDTQHILPTHNPATRARFGRILGARGVNVHTGHRVVGVEPGRVRCANGAAVPLDEVLWVTSASPAPWLRESGLDVDAAGFVRVNEALRSVSDADVFAAGDIAAVVEHPRPKSGVFAVRQGPPLAANLRRALQGRPLRPFRPQARFLSLISTGDRYAVASRGGWALEGRWVWRWKDRIDRRFMRKYNDLPEMAEEDDAGVAPGLADGGTARELSAVAMRCGGCGAKVGSTALGRALGRLEAVAGNGVLVGLDEPDDAAVVEVPADKVILHTVDFFRAFVDDPYVFGQIAANHGLSDVFAMGGEPRTALAVVTVPYGPEEKVEELIFQTLSGALKVLRAADTALIGGHTSEGAELALGFAVNGLADSGRLMRKGGMRPGDRLILTKPLGTGTLLAADMRRKAKGRWTEGALASMLRSNREAAACLQRHGATACTDVTGFGLLGHLLEMVRPSGVDAEIDLGAVPVLEGAVETAAAGILSSLQPENLRARHAVRDSDGVAGHALYPLLFDPQTAGGLLASVPEARATACAAELRGLGYDRAAIIGAVRVRGNRPEPVTVVG